MLSIAHKKLRALWVSLARVKAGSSSFLKKGGARPAGTKKLLLLRRVSIEGPRQQIKVFCFFFSKKKTFFPCLGPENLPAWGEPGICAPLLKSVRVK
jgi:hypothetical protein